MSGKEIIAFAISKSKGFGFISLILSYLKSFTKDGQKVRSLVQMIFLFVILLIGYEYYGFVQYHQNGSMGTYFERPPGVEGFLPISALISLKYWIISGIFNTIHPSGLVIFIIILLLGLLLKKSFCSWICPVGLLSESLWQLGKKIFNRNLKLHKFLDYPLRSLKYLLLFFFAYAVLWTMDADALKKFIYSPYNKVADIKMLLFFTNISEFSLWVIGILVALSVIIKNFWCRYLCPYGALLGFLSMFSPVKVTRNAETCTDCGMCTKVCPNSILVHKSNRVYSDECTACSMCTDVCPVKNTLEFKTSKKSKKKIPTWAFGVTVVLFFLLGTSIARISGYWQNSISDSEYGKRIQEINRPIYEHNRGEVPDYKPGD